MEGYKRYQKLEAMAIGLLCFAPPLIPLVFGGSNQATVPSAGILINDLLIRTGLGLLVMVVFFRPLEAKLQKHHLRIPPVVILLGLGSGLVLFLIAPIFQYLATLVFGPEENSLLASIQESATSMPRILISLAITLSAAFYEEVLYRGWLQGRLRSLGASPIMAALASALLFSLAHHQQGASGMFMAYAYGLILSWLWYRYSSLWIIVIAHGMYNTMSLVGSLW